MSEKERFFEMDLRKKEKRPWHRPLKVDGGDCIYHISAACYEHKPLIGFSPERMRDFEKRILAVACNHSQDLLAWCILPNHYHLLARFSELPKFERDLGQLHGRISFEWNGEEKMRGRKVWHSSSNRIIRTDRHLFSTLNYVHHNPVRHKYVSRWQEWPYSSATDFLNELGVKEAERIWLEYPLMDYGDNWDPADM